MGRFVFNADQFVILVTAKEVLQWDRANVVDPAREVLARADPWFSVGQRL